MTEHTGVFAVYYLYRSRYSFVSDHFLSDGHHVVDFSDLTHALKFPNERSARQFIADDLGQCSSYFTTELSVDELLTHCPDQYELRRAELKGGAA